MADPVDVQERSRPALIVTSTDRSPIVQTITWFLLSCMLLAATIRLLTRSFLLHRLAADDCLLGVAALLAVAQSITILSPEGQIWGRTVSDVDTVSLQRGFKAMYAGNLLYVASLAFAKSSILVSLKTITPVKRHRSAIHIMGLLVVLWFIASEFAFAFECRTPQPWNLLNLDCRRKHSIYLYVSLSNIITDLGVIGLPVWIIAKVHMPLMKRLQVIALFASRMFVVTAVIVQLCYLSGFVDSTDPALAVFPYIVCTQVVQALSILTLSLSHFQPFFKSLQSGLIFNDDITRVVGNSGGKETRSKAKGTTSSSVRLPSGPSSLTDGDLIAREYKNTMKPNQNCQGATSRGLREER